jgi:signal transduction histidine kinase/ligand-binding sensor domain-containing protein/DNA-binding response OmpR family regulator
MLKRIILFFISIIFCQTITAAVQTASIKNDLSELKITSLKDIPAKDVNCIFHDSKGFMWIGTLDGLHRFDGYSYKTYQIGEDTTSISSNLIIAIDEDSKGNIWIGTYGNGICKLNPELDEFTSYENSSTNKSKALPNDITTLIIDDADYLWIGNWFALSRVKFDSTMTEVVNVDNITFNAENTNTNQNVKCIFQDKKKNIWVGTNFNAILIKNPRAAIDELVVEQFNCHSETITDFKDGILIGGVTINSITKSNNGQAYQLHNISNRSSLKILYHDNKIWSGQRNGITCFEENPDGEWIIKKQLQRDFSEESLSSNITTSIINDDLGQIWLGTRGGGVDIISPISNRFSHYKHTANSGSLANDLVMCMFEDSNENLWIGTEEQGASFLQKGKNYATGFSHLMVNNFSNENRVYAITETKTAQNKSIIWMGTSHPKFLAAFNPVTLEEIALPPSISSIGHVFALENQNDSILWVGTYSAGLWRIKLDTNGKILNMKNFTPDLNPNFLSYIIRSIHKDSKGNIWIGTDKGVNRILASETNKATPNFEAFTSGEGTQALSHDYILHIVEAQNGTIWMGTMGGGLIKYLENSDGSYSFSTVSSKDGLPNNTIKTIVEDHNGMLWLASNKGLTRYNPIDGNIINYDKEDGLQDNDFSEICGLRRKNRDFIFGGINGFNVFQTQQLQIDKNKPHLYFTNFQILNTEVKSGELVNGKQVLNKTIEYTKEINLEYKQNSFAIGFVGIQYNSPQKNSYRYILEGFDKEWYKASPDYRLAKYTNLPDGEYTFKVMGSNSDNIWTDEPIQLKITIKPPLYRTPLAITIYAILLILLLVLISRVIKEITQRRRDVLLANVEKERIEEIARLKLQFFTNISHEFRTPLSLISTPLEQLIIEGRHTHTKNQKYNLNLIKHNVNVMMRLINQLLDFRKLDQNKLVLQPSRQSLNSFIENIYNAFEVLAKQKNISYNFYPWTGGDDIWIDVDKMEKVMFNLLSNAFKYTNENGKIVLKAEADLQSNEYIISVSDTGIGIDKDEEIHIFERYYQVDNKKKRNISGTGIGLALAKGFVDLHQGEIGFYPNTEEGTVFYVKLRMGNAHFTNDMFIEPQELNSVPVPEYQSPMLDSTDNEQQTVKSKLPKMLVVEDNFDLRKQIKNIFRNEYRVYEAENGKIGLDLCKAKLPDIIVTDVMMPKMDGMEMCKQIKLDEQISHIPIMILTAKNTDDTIVEGYDLGADGYVMKPFNVVVLKARVNSLVKNREQLRARFQKEIEINPKIISNTPADSKFLDKILELIETNLSESEYSVEQLAEDYGVSRIYLNRKIKALTGETTNEFMRNIKLKHAAELLKQNKLNISEVAWDVGYNDIRTFRKRFKEKFEMSPSEFARQYK